MRSIPRFVVVMLTLCSCVGRDQGIENAVAPGSMQASPNRFLPTRCGCNSWKIPPF